MASSLCSSAAAFNKYDTNLRPYVHCRGKTHDIDEQEELIHEHGMYPVSTVSRTASPGRKPFITPLGSPATKKRLHMKSCLAAALSCLCLVAAITTVADKNVSWFLGVGTNQLIVLGFLLSVMNLCLDSVTPTLFLHLEAKIGPSKLQNYDGILRNQMFASRVDFTWRLVLGFMLALPLGLSIAYKKFTGGESVKFVNAIDYGIAPYYGMFAPPGLQSKDSKTGIQLFSNATLPFTVASSTDSINGAEPPIPVFPRAYGYNILLLNDESTAMLDIPGPDYVSAVQSLLALGESWSLTASVFGTVANLNHSKEADPDGYNSTFMDLCVAAEESSGAYADIDIFDGKRLVLLDHASPGNQSSQYIGFAPSTYTPVPGYNGLPCSDFSPYATLYDVTRQPCRGTWSVTRGGIELVDGSCNGIILPPEQQMVVTNNNMFLDFFFLPSLVELLGPFADARNQSDWAGPYMATGVAAMLWSRMTNLHGVNLSRTSKPWKVSNGTTFSNEDIGIIYSTNDSVFYTRPTLRKSGLLYGVLAIQPLLTIAALLLTAIFHSTPLDKGFGLVSILSGINRRSLDAFSGAALSGELTKDVKLEICPYQDNRKGTIEYHVVPHSSTKVRNGRLVRNTVYH